MTSIPSYSMKVTKNEGNKTPTGNCEVIRRVGRCSLQTWWKWNHDILDLEHHKAFKENNAAILGQGSNFKVRQSRNEALLQKVEFWLNRETLELWRKVEIAFFKMQCKTWCIFLSNAKWTSHLNMYIIVSRKEPFKTTYVSYRKSLLFNERDREWLELVCNNSR